MTKRDRPFRTPYRSYDVLAKWDTPSWNPQTRATVAERLHTVPERRFLDAEDYRVLEAACERLLPQPDRPGDPVPIAPFIDDSLCRNAADGTRLPGVPPPREAWRRGLRALDAEARARYGAGFADLAAACRDSVLEGAAAGRSETDAWQGMPPETFFTGLLLKSVVTVYYAHPSAWSEIGYGGPASPRGYARLAGHLDPWEARRDDE